MANQPIIPFILSDKYFKIKVLNGLQVEAECLKCPPSASKKTFKGSLAATGNFHLHLKRKHEDVLDEYDKELKEHLASKKNTKKARLGPVEGNLSITDCKGFTKKDPPKQMSAFDKKIVSFIVGGMHPLSIVEEPGFQALFLPERKILSSETYRRRIQVIAEEMMQDLTCKLKGAAYVCLTSDMWTCTGMSRSFMGMTAHWITKRNGIIARESAVLACKRFMGSHTYDRIAEMITSIMKQFSIDKDKVAKIVTDNATNFAKAFSVYTHTNLTEETVNQEDDDFIDISELLSGENLDDDHEERLTLPSQGRCASHTLSLVCSSDIPKMKASRLHQAAFAKCYGIWNKISRSQIASESVKAITITSLKTPVKTRWNSTYDSLMDLLTRKAKFDEICSATQVVNFTADEINYLEVYCKCVEPIAVALDQLQGEKDTYYGELLPTLFVTKNKLAALVEAPPKNSGKLTEVIYNGFITRFKKFLELEQEVVDAIIASVSHPFHKLRWVPKDKIEEIKKTFIAGVLKEGQDDNLNDEPPSQNQTTQASSAESFFGYGQEIAYEILEEDRETRIKQQCLNFLLNDETNFKILQQFPLIEKVFIKYNTALPSSAPVERLFSYSSMILNPKRRRLTDEMFETLTMLKCNGF